MKLDKKIKEEISKEDTKRQIDYIDSEISVLKYRIKMLGKYKKRLKNGL